MAQIEIGPSILTADFLRLGEQIAEAEEAGVDFIHLDVMDGRFVPNITFGAPVVNAVRRQTELPIDVHLMIEEPERYLEMFVDAGADWLTIQVETTIHLHAALRKIEELGAHPGVTLNPLTPLEAIEESIPFVHQVLVMSVNPGFGGQHFIPTSLDRIRRLRTWLDERNPQCVLEVDGGIKASNIGKCIAAGAGRFVVGSAIYNDTASVAESVAALRVETENA